MIYAVIASQCNLKEISDKIVELGYDLYADLQEEFSAVFVSYGKTSKELSDELELGVDKERIDSVIVLRVTDYYGYASKHLWEWIRVRESV